MRLVATEKARSVTIHSLDKREGEMQAFPNRPISKISKPSSLTIGLKSIFGMFVSWVGFFKLTKEERLAAGICVKGEGYDE
jgi:hypothetical protein